MPFAFDAGTHTYIDTDTGLEIPHITGMLERAGLIDTRWYTEESCARGTEIHRLTADYDRGLTEDLGAVDTPYRGWLLAHGEAMRAIPHEWAYVEEAFAHEARCFAGRPDRVGRVYGAVAVLDVKSGPEHQANRIQTALQAILMEPVVKLPANAIQRYGLYLKRTGKYRLIQFEQPDDLRLADNILRRFAR